MSKKDGDQFGSEIERMLMDRPITRQAGPEQPRRDPLPMASGMVTNTLDDLMAELGMLRERAENAGDRGLGRNGTRNGPRVSDGAMLTNADVPLRPMTPRTSAAAAAASASSGGSGSGLVGSHSVGSSGLVLPPAKGAMLLPSMQAPSLQAPNSPSLMSQGNAPSPAAMGNPGSLGPVRAQSPMNMRRSVAGAPGGASGSGTMLAPVAQLSSGGMGPPSGMLERQAQLEMRLEKMEVRENSLMSLINQLQQQVQTLSRAQQATQQQLAAVSSAAPAAAGSMAAVTAASSVADGRQASPSPVARAAAAAAAPSIAAPVAAPVAPHGSEKVSDEDFIQEDNGSDDEKAPTTKMRNGAVRLAPPPPLKQGGTTLGGAPTPPAGAAPAPGGAAGRPAVGSKLVPGGAGAAEWESDMTQLRKELSNVAGNLVRLREQVGTLVPGGTSLMSEEMAVQAAASQQLKSNLTQIAMDVVSLHKGLSTLKQSTAQAHAALEKSIVDVSVQGQTNALTALTQSQYAPQMQPGAPNAVASALAAQGGVSGTLEDSLRNAFSRPAMREMPQFNIEAAGFMPDNGGVAAAAAMYGGGMGGGMGGMGGGGMSRQQQGGGGGGGGGLNGAWALLNSFEEQAAVEKAEQQKAAVIAHQAVAIVDAKVKQVVLHVDRHMQLVSNDVEERLRMYEQTIIRMAQQIDRVQRVMRELEGAATSRITVRQGGQEMEETPQPPPRPEPTEQEDTAKTVVKENWLKAAAMATGRFVKQEEEKKTMKAAAHGYFGAPRSTN